MESKVECYYIILDLHGPESRYASLYQVLKELGAEKLQHGFPVWMFIGKPDSHNEYDGKFIPLLPALSVDSPDVRCGYLLMSARGFSSSGVYEPKSG